MDVKLSIPDESLSALHATKDTIGAELLLAAAIKLFELGRLSSGAAALLAGVPKAVFLRKLADYDADALQSCEEGLAADLRDA
jgi:hypothetical protein